MLLLTPVLIALTIALLRGGSLRNLATLPLRGTAFFLAALAVQIVLYLPGIRTSALVHDYGAAFYVVSMGLALVGALRNWRLGVALRVAALGLALNTLVIALNGGYMPTNAAAMQAVQGTATVREIANPHLYGNTHFAGPSTRLTVFSDVIPVRVPGGPGNVYSVGDVLLAAGIAVLVYRATRRPYTRYAPRLPAGAA